MVSVLRNTFVDISKLDAVHHDICEDEAWMHGRKRSAYNTSLEHTLVDRMNAHTGYQETGSRIEWSIDREKLDVRIDAQDVLRSKVFARTFPASKTRHDDIGAAVMHSVRYEHLEGNDEARIGLTLLRALGAHAKQAAHSKNPFNVDWIIYDNRLRIMIDGTDILDEPCKLSTLCDPKPHEGNGHVRSGTHPLQSQQVI